MLLQFCASFHSHRSIQTGVTVRKRQIRVKIGHFLSRVTLKFDKMTLKNNRAPLLCYFKLCASFHRHGSFQAGVKSSETPNSGQNRPFFAPCDLEIWQITLKNNGAPLLCCFQLCAWFHCHMWIQNGVRVRKRLSWVLTSVTLTFDLDLLHGHHLCPW